MHASSGQLCRSYSSRRRHSDRRTRSSRKAIWASRTTPKTTTFDAKLQPPPKYRFQPSRTQYRLPSSPSRMTNFSHRPSLPEPMTRRVCSSDQPMRPFAGRPRDAPSGGTSDEPCGSSPISKWALANEYTSENTLGNNGILPRMPHLCLISSEPDDGDWLRRDRPRGCGRSKMCNVDLSDVTASKELDGEIARENMSAWSTPRRSSAIFAQLLVE